MFTVKTQACKRARHRGEDEKLEQRNLFDLRPQTDDQRQRAADDEHAAEQFAPANIFFFHKCGEHLGEGFARRRLAVGGRWLVVGGRWWSCEGGFVNRCFCAYDGWLGNGRWFRRLNANRRRWFGLHVRRKRNRLGRGRQRNFQQSSSLVRQHLIQPIEFQLIQHALFMKTFELPRGRIQIVQGF